jgi:flagellar biosynthesis regulator FlaF
MQDIINDDNILPKETQADIISEPIVAKDEATLRREHALNELKLLITSTLATKMEEIKAGLTQKMVGQEVNN